MKYVDFAFQTLVFAFVILALGYSLISEMDFNDNLMVIACAAIILGPWQMASSFISIIAKSGFYKLKTISLHCRLCISVDTLFYKSVPIITKQLYNFYLSVCATLWPFYFLLLHHLPMGFQNKINQ